MSATAVRQRQWRVPGPPEADTDWFVDREARYLLLPAWPEATPDAGLTDTYRERVEPRSAEASSNSRTDKKRDRTGGSDLLSSSLGQSVGTLLSRVTGLGRIVAMSVVFGQSLFTDQFNNANTAPNMIYELLLGGVLSATLVPLFSRAADTNDDDATNALVSTSVVTLAFLAIASVVGAPLIHYCFTLLMGSSARAKDALVVVPLMRLLLPQIFLYGLMTIVTAALHARQRFIAAAFTPVLGNLVFIATFVAANLMYGREIRNATTPTGLVLVLGIGTTLGVATMVFSLFVAVYDADLSFRWNFKPRHPAVIEMVKLSSWTLGYAAANQIALIAITAIARRDATTLSAYQTAFVFFQLPHGLIAVSVMNSIVPVMSRAFLARNGPLIQQKYREGVSVMMTIILIASALLWFCSAPLIKLCLGYGLFGAAAQETTAQTVRALAIGLPGFSLYLLTLRVFYSKRDTRSPFILCVGQNVLNIALIVVLLATSPERPSVALAYAYAVSYLIAAVAAVALANRRMPGLVTRSNATDIAAGCAYAAVALAIAAGTNYLINGDGSNAILSLVVAAVSGMVGLAVAILLFHQYGFESIAKVIRRSPRPVE